MQVWQGCSNEKLSQNRKNVPALCAGNVQNQEKIPFSENPKHGVFKWGAGWGGTFLSGGGGQSGGAHAPPTQTYAPHLKPLCFLVCVWVRLM